MHARTQTRVHAHADALDKKERIPLSLTRSHIGASIRTHTLPYGP